MNEFNKKYKSKSDIPTVIFLILWLIGFSIKWNDLLSSKNYTFIFVGILVTFYALFFLAWALTGTLKINIDCDKLMVTKNYLGISVTKKFDLNKIENIKTESNIDSGTYWGLSGFRLADKDNNVMTFYYHNKRIVIGRKTSGFAANELIKYLKNR